MTTAANGPALRWQVLVDWAGNGLWAAANADVSDDVLALRWEWGRRGPGSGHPPPEFAPPAALELSLRNRNGRYTPGNTASPLAGMVAPGREIRLRTAYLYDDFAPSNAAVGAAEKLAGRAAAGARHPVWQTRAGAGFTLQGGIARAADGRAGGRPADAVATLDIGDPLATLLVRYRRGSDGRGGFVLRCAAADDCLRLRFGNRHTYLERVAGRRITQLDAGAPLPAGQWHELEIVQRDAASVQIFATNLDTTDQDAAGTVRREILSETDIAGAPVSGQHGLWSEFRNAADQWGGFRAGRSLFCGQIAAITPDYPDAGQCRIRAVDALGRLDGIRLWRALPAGAVTAGQIAAAILGWAGLTAADYALDGGRTLRSGGPRAVWNLTAGTALRRLQREENGLMYADGLGRVCLEASAGRAAVRTHRNPSSLARATIGDSAGAGGDPGASAVAYAGAIRRDDGAAAVEDAVTFRYHRPSDKGRQSVWSLNEPLAVPAGAAVDLLAASDRWEAVTDVATPVGGVDYTATDDADGAGADVTANITVTALSEGASGVSGISGVSGRGRRLRIANAGAQTAYLQTLRLTAAHCWQSDGSIAVRAARDGNGAGAGASSSSGAQSQGQGQGQSRVIRCQYADHYAAAQGAAESRLAEHSRPRARLDLELPLSRAANCAAAAEARISDVIAIASAEPGANGLGINGAWLLEGMAVAAAGGAAATAQWWLTAV